jgi:hypothetical protein
VIASLLLLISNVTDTNLFLFFFGYGCRSSTQHCDFARVRQHSYRLGSFSRRRVERVPIQRGICPFHSRSRNVNRVQPTATRASPCQLQPYSDQIQRQRLRSGSSSSHPAGPKLKCHRSWRTQFRGVKTDRLPIVHALHDTSTQSNKSRPTVCGQNSAEVAIAPQPPRPRSICNYSCHA